MPGARKKAAVAEPAPHRESPPTPPPFDSVGDWHLPTEIRRFFRSRVGQSLLIRGAPGTGKTTLALSLLAGLKTPGFYVSTRVFYPELVEHYPWLHEHLPEDHLVDAEALWPGAEGRREYGSLIRQFTQLSPESEEFSNLDKFLTLPPGVQEVFSRFPPGERSALVIDSWDGLIEPYLGNPAEPPSTRHRLRIENALISVLSKANVHTILIQETASFTSLEYLVHGVIELRRDDLEGMVIRELLYHKLRGVPLQSSSVLFSLEGGRFTSVPRSFPHMDPVADERFQVRENPPNGLSWGVAEFDRTLGPLRVGEPALIEYEPRVDRNALRPISDRTVAQAIGSGWEVTILADLPFSLSGFLAGLGQLIEPAKAREHTASFTPPPLIQPGTLTPPATRQMIEQLKESITTRSFVGVVLGALSASFGTQAEFVDAIASLCTRTTERGGILLLIGSASTAGISEIVSSVRNHIRATHHHRATLIYGVRPSTPALALLTNTRRGEYPGLWALTIR
jgi:KaiC/GvpD/RAD55 family RecA-like ATPase